MFVKIHSMKTIFEYPYIDKVTTYKVDYYDDLAILRDTYSDSFTSPLSARRTHDHMLQISLVEKYGDRIIPTFSIPSTFIHNYLSATLSPDKPTYKLLYQDDVPHFSISSLANTTNYNWDFGNYLRKTNGDCGKETFWFSNCYVVYTQHEAYDYSKSKWVKRDGEYSLEPKPAYLGVRYVFKLYVLNDTRVFTDCCLKALCYPTIYKSN